MTTHVPGTSVPVDILIPTYHRPAALAVTLAGLVGQQQAGFNVVISDQTENIDSFETPELQAVVRVLRLQGHAVDLYRRLSQRGMAEQRQFLLDRSTAPYVLYLDDDLVLEPDVVERLLSAIREERCGFVGSGLIGPSFLDDHRPDEQAVEFWEGPVEPESIDPRKKEWNRHRLHNAANIYHLQKRLGLDRHERRKYRVAWIGGCVMYDSEKLRKAGGFSFWQDLPPSHCGEDVLAQLNVMRRYGGCGLLPSGVYHQELPTTLPDRSVSAPEVLLKP